MDASIPMLLAECAGAVAEWVLSWDLVIVALYVAFGVQAFSAKFSPRLNHVPPTASGPVSRALFWLADPGRFLIALGVVFVTCAVSGYGIEALGYWWADRYIGKAALLPILAGATAVLVWTQRLHAPLDRLFSAERRADEAEEARADGNLLLRDARTRSNFFEEMLNTVARARNAVIGAARLDGDEPMDVDMAVFVYSRGGALRELGLSDDDVVGRAMGDYATPEFTTAVQKAAQTKSAQPYTTTLVIKGETRTYDGVLVAGGEEVVSPDGEEGQVVLWISLDVTARVAAYAELEARRKEDQTLAAEEVLRKAMRERV